MIRDLWLMLRPAQWAKNVFVLAGLLFGAKLSDPHALWLGGWAFISFCLVASSVYIVNDITDREQDRLHPIKRERPLARGAVSLATAWLLSLTLLFLGGVVSVALLPRGFWLVLGSYWVLILAYSLALKKRVILDVIVISMGFVLRALGGVVAVDVALSPWLIVCTFTLCLFLGFGKRRCELAVMGGVEEAIRHRPTLGRYTPVLLNHLISITAGLAVITFLLYTMEETKPAPPFPKELLLYTIPLVIYGVFRYAMLIEGGAVTGPTDIIIGDRPFLATLVAWALLAGLIVYKGNEIKDFFERERVVALQKDVAARSPVMPAPDQTGAQNVPPSVSTVGPAGL
ncbi:MAG: decaprenyl-phosphate phosphoribosyltransferase [Phycisphaerales bacterium]|nr:MAG: decaprenyl-phosphate phosphoribosyltransferase [Phycisphaerales bacterium]